MHFIELTLHFVQAEHTKKMMKDDKLLKEFTEFKKNLIVWASPNVINAYNEFQDSCEPSNNEKHILQLTDKLFRELRKDLGHNDSNLPVGDLVGLILNSQGKKELKDLYKT